MKRGGSFLSFFFLFCLIQINTLQRRNWKRNKTFFVREQKSLPDIYSSEWVFLLICEFKNEFFHRFPAWMCARIYVSVYFDEQTLKLNANMSSYLNRVKIGLLGRRPRTCRLRNLMQYDLRYHVNEYDTQLPVNSGISLSM